jgi:hypothetical protein
MGLYIDSDDVGAGGDDIDIGGDGSGTAGAEIMAGGASGLLDETVGAGSCFFPFLAIVE